MHSATVLDEKLTEFALLLVATGHADIPRESDIDFLTQAEAAFVPPQPKTANGKKQKPTAIKEAKPSAKKATPLNKNWQLRSYGEPATAPHFAGDFPPPAPPLTACAPEWIEARLAGLTYIRPETCAPLSVEQHP